MIMIIGSMFLILWLVLWLSAYMLCKVVFDTKEDKKLIVDRINAGFICLIIGVIIIIGSMII